MSTHRARCLILSCGNTLRGDDGVGPWLSEWARERYAGDSSIAVLTRHQWTPDLAVDLAEAETALFIDCSIDTDAGEIRLREVAPAAEESVLNTHHIGAPELLGLAKTYYAAAPRRSLLLTVGAGSTELSEEFSAAVQAALPGACVQLEHAVADLLQAS